jgi:molecular chaperone GrpE
MNQDTPLNTLSPSDEDFASEKSPTLAAEVFELKLAEEKQRYQQLVDDFDNFRDRTAKETDRRAALQKESLIHELLPALDNLDRALTVDPNVTFEQLQERLAAISQQLRQILRPAKITANNLGQ